MIVLVLSLLLVLADNLQAEEAPVKEQTIEGPHKLAIKIRMEGPYTADTPLQIVCYFKHKPAGDKTLGAAVELDKELGGVIASLRNRGEFEGEALETLLLTPPPGTIKAERLLLIGLGDEESLSLDRLEQIGHVAVREAVRLGVERAAFAPIIRDQGNSKFETGQVANAVLRGVLLGYDTESRLQQAGFAKPHVLEQWSEEAGPLYFDETAAAAQAAVAEAEAAIAARPSSSYRSDAQ